MTAPTPSPARIPARRAHARAWALLVALSLACAHAPARQDATPPSWHHGAVVYGVVPPLFGPDHPLESVIARLDALADLGVDWLWLAPVTDTDDRGAISYAVTDYWHVRDDYGTAEDLRTLVREAHARRMKVLLDFVPNHTSVGHPFYRDAAARGRASPWWGFYLRGADGEARYDFDWKHLRKLDYGNPAVRRMMTDAFAYWVRELDVDGFRVDAAWGVRDRAPDFWPALVRDLRRQKPGLVLIAEASAREPYWVRSGFDAAYDWTAELGHAAWEKAFDDPAHVAPALDAALASRATPMDRVLRFLDNNDTGARFVTRHGVALTGVAAVLAFTLPGVPALFTGDEVCAEYEPYEDPPPIRWQDACGLGPLYRRLAALREELPALRDGRYVRVPVPGNDAVFAFVRDAGSEGQVLVVLNFGPAARVRLQPPGPPRAVPRWDALAQRPVPLTTAGPQAFELDLPPTTAVVLTRPP